MSEQSHYEQDTCAPFDSRPFKYFTSRKYGRIPSRVARRPVQLPCLNDTTLAGEALASGLFRDVGQVVLASVLRGTYDEIVRRAVVQGEPVWKVEVLGFAGYSGEFSDAASQPRRGLH